MMNKEELLTRMIKLYGFEHEAVIEFADAMDSLPIEVLKTIVKCHKENPILFGDEE